MEEIRAIYAYTFCDSLWYVLFSDVLGILVDLYVQVLGIYVLQWNFLSAMSSFGKFAMKWSSDPHLKQIFDFRPLNSVNSLLKLRESKGGFLRTLSFLCYLKHFKVGCEPPQWLHLDWKKKSFPVFLTEMSKLKWYIRKEVIDNYFWSDRYILSSVMFDGLLYEKIFSIWLENVLESVHQLIIRIAISNLNFPKP